MRQQIDIADIKKKNPNLKVTLVFTRPLAEDEHVPRYNHKGRLNEDWMNQNINTDSEAYLCGPVEFMRAMYQFLSNAGVPKEDIHYELFQAGADITK